ncbi:Beta-1,2-xylosyltransferase 1-like protein 3 [Colletotrichum chlorophyti]|uniref:Beta-1,2-xylosyltransferase 1-like protein 3 n=1 Tax=Colletotrichum chlorophyti TaxID=708187 RepID=A0A1Q8RXI1_9PEZI|nr:Beta-1,2-xylosyltransferase 1-like protein 3 [Colletotrichum chlorophyti]
MAAPLNRNGILAACILLIVCTAWTSARYNSSAAFERPIQFSILVFLECGLFSATWSRVKYPATKDENFQISLIGPRAGWKVWLDVEGSIRRVRRFLFSFEFLLACVMILRSLLFWRTVLAIHCSWETLETFLPALIALYTAVSPTVIQLGQPAGQQNRFRHCFTAVHIRYVVVAIIWACAATATLALSTKSAGAICPPGHFRWERQTPLVQALAVVLDAWLLAVPWKWQQDPAADNKSLWARVPRLFLTCGVALSLLACISFHNPHNVRWAFTLDYVAVRDLLVDSSVVSTTLFTWIYIATDVHPSTVALMITASGAYTHQLIRMLQTLAPVDDYLMYTIAGGLSIAGVGLLLRYEKGIVTPGFSGDPRLTRFLTGLYIILVGVLCGTYLVFYPDSASSDALPFPDFLSAADTQSDAWIAQANSSSTLSEAVSEYRRRYGVAPPPNFDKWFAFAVARGSPIIDDFAQINDDLLPFWGVEPGVLRQRTEHAMELLGMGGIRVRGGKVEVAPGTPGSHQWMMQSMKAMIEPFSEHLPDLDFAVNLNDEPRVAIPYERTQELIGAGWEARARVLRNHELGGFDVSKTGIWGDGDTVKRPEVTSPFFNNRIRDQIYYELIAPTCPPDSPARNTRWWSRRSSCADCVAPHAVHVFDGLEESVVTNWTAATDLCHQPDMAYLHGFLLSPSAAVFTKEAFPVFSQSKVSGFADVLVPSPWNYEDKAEYRDEEGVKWEEKKDGMLWRGSASDGYAARGSWQSFLRARFVWLAGALGRGGGPEFDVGFVGGWSRCHASDCRAEKETFWGPGREEPPEGRGSVPFGEHWRHKHLMDLDGAGFSGRFIPFLRSRSLVYRAGLFRTWFCERVHAWRHYVPVDVRLREVKGLLGYFGTHRDGTRRAEGIAGEGRAWAARALRREDMEVYMFRLLLEWGRLVDDGREGLGFAG